MLNNKCAPLGLVVAAAAGALLSGAPANAQPDLAQYWHHHSVRVYHRSHHLNLNRNRPRIFIRIYIYNRNNNVAIAGQREQQHQNQNQPTAVTPAPAPDLAAEPGGVLGAPAALRRSGFTGLLAAAHVGRPVPADEPSDRPYIVRDQPATQAGQGAAADDQKAPGVVRHDPATVDSAPDGAWPTMVGNV